ncbi:hypothetical protein VNO80_08375 [Phaseolus coccineus]|uniref:Uncharacterized protein n=1 Tax=Phaseolus coccineus TaxID=3886 RepID=A0AAN9NQ53_PHACN
MLRLFSSQLLENHKFLSSNSEPKNATLNDNSFEKCSYVDMFLQSNCCLDKTYMKVFLMAGLLGYKSLPPKAKNLVVAGGLTAFVFGAYFYTMRAVGGTDELQVAIDKFESDKSKNEGEPNMPSKV